MYEQLSIFDIQAKNKNIDNQGLGEPCESCDIEWCSVKCFIRRGYMWDRFHRFIKDEKGNKIRKEVENRECRKDY